MHVNMDCSFLRFSEQNFIKHYISMIEFYYKRDGFAEIYHCVAWLQDDFWHHCNQYVNGTWPTINWFFEEICSICLIVLTKLIKMQFVGITTKGRISNGCFKRTKHAKFSEKRTFLTPDTQTYMRYWKFNCYVRVVLNQICQLISYLFPLVFNT